MSKTIDERVVEMRFDNEDFESNAKESLSTLDRLKQALSFKTSTKEIDELSRSVGNVDMTGLGGAVEAVKNKFSALEVIAVTALMNITNKAINAGEALVKSLTLDQIGAGWDKYADKTTAVQTIMAATASQFTNTAEQMEYVNAQLDKLNAFTDETSYNFVDMVGNIGKFTSNNIKLETAVTSMQGIATWAAISGQNAGTASRAMYQLSQAMGSGVIRLQDWMSIEQANMSTAEFKQTAMDTAVALGTLTKSADGTYKTMEGNVVTIENFRNTLQDLWFTSDVLTESLEKYGKFADVVLDISDATGVTVTDLISMTEEFKEGTIDLDKWMDETGLSADELQGYLEQLGDEELDLGFRAMRAAQEAKTFGEAIDSVKDAVSTGWMKTFEIIFGDYEQAKELFTGLANELYDVFAESGNARNELLEEAFSEKSGGWGELAKRVEECGVSVDDFKNVLIDTARQHGIEIDKMISEEGSFEATLKNGWLNGDLIKEGLDTFTNGLDTVSDSTGKAKEKIDELGEIAKRVIVGEFGNGADRIKRLTDAGYDYAEVQEAVNKVLSGQELSYENLSDAQMEELGLTEDQIKSLRELGDQATSTEGDVADLINTLTEDRKSGRTLLFESAANVWNSLKKIIGSVKEAWQEVFPPATADQIYNNLKAVNSFSEKLLEFSNKVAPGVKAAFKSIFLVLDTFLSAAKQVASFLSGLFMNALSKVDFKMGDLSGTLLGLVQRFHDWVAESTPIKSVLEKISNGAKVLYDWVVKLIEQISKLPIVQDAIKGLQDIFAYFVDKFSAEGTGLTGILQDFTSFISEQFPRLSQTVSNLVDDLKTMDTISFDNILGSLTKFKDDIIDLFFNGIKQGNLFKTMITKIKTTARDTLDKVNSGLSNFNAGTVLSVALASSLIATILKFGDLAKAIKTPFDLINKLVNSVAGAFSNLGVVFKAAAFVPAAIGIGLVALAIGQLAKVPVPNVLAAAGAISSVGISLAIFMAAVKMGNKGGGAAGALKGIATLLLEIGLAITAIGIGLYAVSQMDLEGIAPKLLIFIGIVGVMFLVSVGLAKLAPRMEASVSGVLMMVGFAASVWILVKALKDIALAISDGNDLIDATDSLLKIILSFGAVMAAIGYIGGKGLKGGATSMILMAVALKLVASALMGIAQNFDSALIQSNMDGLKYVFGALIVLAGIALIAGQAVSKSMLGMVASVGLMALVLYMISVLNINPSMGALTAFGAVILGIMGIMKAVSMLVNMDPETKFHQLGLMMLEFSAAIAILIAAVALVGMIPTESIVKGTLAVGALMAFMALLIFVTKYAQDVKGEIIALTVVMGVLVAAVALFAFMGPEAQQSIWNGVAAVGALMAMLALLIVVTQFAQSALPGMAMVIGVVVVVGVVIGLLAAFSDTDKIAVIADALAKIFGTLALVMIAITIAGAAAAVAVVGLVEMIALFGIMLVLIGLMDELNGEEDTLLKALQSTLPLFETIGEMIGRVFGGIVKGFSTSAKEAMQELTTGLKDLAGGLDTLGNSANADVLDAVGSLVQAVTLLTADNFINGILKIFGNKDPLTKFGETLVALGPQLSSFGAEVKDVKPSVINSVAKVMESITNVAENFTNSGNVELMGKTLETFGPQLHTFYENISDLDPDNVRAMAESLTVFADSASQVQGVVSNGGLNVEDLLSQYNIPVEYSSIMQGNVGDPATTTDQMYSLIMQSMNNGSIPLLGQASDTGNGLVENVANGMLNSMPSVDSGIQSLSDKLINGLPLDQVNWTGQSKGEAYGSGAAQGILNSVPLVQQASSQMDTSAFQSILSNLPEYYQQGSNAGGNYATGINSQNGEATSAGDEISKSVISGMDPKLPEFLQKGTASAEQFLLGISGKNDSATTAGATLSSKVLYGISLNVPMFYTAGQNAGIGFANGVQSQVGAAAAAGTNLGVAALNAAKRALNEHSPSKAFFQVGDYAGIGYVQGLLDNAKNAYDAGTEIGGSSVDGVRSAIHAISQYIGDSLDATPTITPILDLSEVRNSSALLASMLNDSIGVTSINASVAAAPVRRSYYGGYGFGIQNGINPQNSTTEINNTFYVQSRDPQGVANETSRIIQRQIERRDAANGRVGL